MAHKVCHGETLRCNSFCSDGVIGRLLDLDEEASRADGMGNTALDKVGVARLYGELMQAIEHRGNILSVKAILPDLSGNSLLEAEINARGLAVDLATAENMPAFGLAEHGVK